MVTSVNGSVVMRISKLTMGGDVPMTKGRMGLQIEGSHVQWRNWQVMDLSIPATSIAGAAKRDPAIYLSKGNGRLGNLKVSRGADYPNLFGAFDMEGREITGAHPVFPLPPH